MTANELRTMYVNFFKERGHKEIASASLLPENDPTVLFTMAGMHPLVPYLLGEKHPSGRRLTDVQIYRYGRKENWWGPAGQTGPCGPDTEIFYDMGQPQCGPDCGPACNCGKYVEIWNNVFMQFKEEDKTLTISEKRIICEHMRAITFILGDPMKIVPSNTEQGYILRRLIRRVIRLFKKADIGKNYLCELSKVLIDQYGEVYPELCENRDFILEQLQKEHALFSKTLDEGLKKAHRYLEQVEKGGILSGELTFKLYDTYGFPVEFSAELAQEQGKAVDMEGFHKKFEEHQNKSRQGAAGKFAGGLADHNEQTARLHTATHLLNGALRKVLGEEVYQRGSNITAERLRFDFSFPRKVTKEELEQVSQIVNEAIEEKLEVQLEEMPLEEAYNKGAMGVFAGKYQDMVKVYTIPGYSKEICGGPHAKNTGELGSFKILKEEASSAGVRRIKAVIES